MPSNCLKRVLIVLASLLITAAASHATIEMNTGFEVDLTNPVDAQAKATWSEPDKITVSKEGLGWDGDGASSRDGWIETKPIALGLSWRPTSAVYVRVTIQPPPREFALANGQKSTPYGGDVYLRYSPDLKHWSSWQVLQRSEPQSTEEKKNPGRYFTGTVRVPYRDMEQYRKLVMEYSRMDVPWKSDEEAAVKWILGRDPDFFARQIPFMGYVQLMFETQSHGGQRIQSFKASIMYGMGGLHVMPRDASEYEKRDIPWRYKADDAIAATTRPANGEGQSRQR